MYERKVSDILTLMAEIGGLHKALFTIGMILVSFVAQKVFMSNVVRRIYQVRNYENIKSSEQLKFQDDYDDEEQEVNPNLKKSHTFTPYVNRKITNE
jgi:hypothetical protein